jgi:hypothetical protein
MTTEQTRALNALNYLCGLAQGSVHIPEVHESMEISFKEIYNFIYPEGAEEPDDPAPKEAPCECDL